MDRLRAERPDLARRVLPLEGRQIDHPDREVERPELRGLLDRALLERVDPLLDADLVDRADPPEQAAERAGPAVPRAHELVGALAGEGVGAMGGGHGTARIHPPPGRPGRQSGGRSGRSVPRQARGSRGGTPMAVHSTRRLITRGALGGAARDPRVRDRLGRPRGGPRRRHRRVRVLARDGHGRGRRHRHVDERRRPGPHRDGRRRIVRHRHDRRQRVGVGRRSRPRARSPTTARSTPR